jgi:hypothetical protein
MTGATGANSVGMPTSKALRRPWVLIALVLFAATAVIAWSRAGLLDLPSAPPGVTADCAGLAGLDDLRRTDAWLWSRLSQVQAFPEGKSAPAAAQKVRDGIEAVDRGDPLTGLELMRQGIALDPQNLAYANAYRMVTFRLKRDHLLESPRCAHARVSVTPSSPAHFLL